MQSFREEKTLAKAPLAIFIHSRPKQTALVLEVVKKYQPENLYVIADGPRPTHPGDFAKCEEARALFASPGWECQVHTMFRPTNVGVGKSVKEGLDWVFSRESSLIILEDDTVPDLSFFEFCEQLLERFAEDERVGMISGSKLVSERSNAQSAFSFARLPSTWGWATWSRTWQGVDWDLSWRKGKEISTLKNISLNRKHFYYLRHVLSLLDSKAVDTWDYQFSFSLANRRLYTIIPRESLVENIGFGDAATHTFRRPKGVEMKLGSLKLDFAGQSKVRLNRKFERAWLRRIVPERRPERLWLKSIVAKIVQQPMNSAYRRLLVRNGATNHRKRSLSPPASS